ncbi:MAG: PAS domain S-box protein [Mucilaginibacter sp.]
MSIIVLLGWMLNVTAFQTILPVFEPMRFNTALCFVLLGGALLTTQYKTHYYPSLFYILSSLVIFIALVTFSQNLFHFSAGLDQLFVKDGRPLDPIYPFPGRMSVNSSICFLLLGIGLLILTAKRRVFHIVAQYSFHLVTVLSSIGIIGYLNRASFFYDLSGAGPMAVQTVVLFFFISISASLLQPSLGITNLFSGQLVGNKMARRLFILIIFGVIALGTLRVQTRHYYEFSVELSVALATVCFLLICLLIVWNTAIWLNRIDTKRSEAEAEIKLMNADLEKRVIERTAEFRKSEEKYRSLIEHASDAIYVVDFKGNFTDVNASLCKMTGYTREELMGLNVEDIIDPEQLKVDPVKHGPRNPDEYVMRERRLLRKDKSIFDAEINVKMFHDDRILVIARDITSRKKLEAEHREAELKFRTLAEKSMVGVYISQKERFTYVNPRFAEIFGYEPHELINTTDSAVNIIINEEARAAVWKNIQARYSGEIDHVHYEVVGTRKDGTLNYVEFYGNRAIIDGQPSIIGTMLDITQRKKAEELILKEKELSESIINSLPGVFYLQNEKGEYLRWNKNFETVIGYTSEEIPKLTAKDLVGKDDLERVRETIKKIFSDGYATVESKVITKDGVKIPYLLTGIPIMYENQHCLLGTGIDISSRIKAEEELRYSEQKYKLLFESNPVPMWMIAKDDLSIIAVNDAAASLYGYTKDELLHMSVTALRPEEDRENQIEGYKREISGGADVGVIRHLKKDGTVMFVQIAANDIIFEGRPVRLSLTNDVTERLKAEEALKKSEANLLSILKTTDTAYGLFDKDLKIVAYNEKAIQFVTEQFHHIPDKNDQLADFFPQERFPHFIDLAAEVLKGKTLNYEIDYPQDDGSVFWFDVRLFPITNDNKEILGMMLSLYNITGRKNTERDLKVAYERIHSHINSIKDMVWKQSHLIRSPLANLKALAAMLKEHPTDTEVLDHFQSELDRMDAIIVEMAEDASDHGISD